MSTTFIRRLSVAASAVLLAAGAAILPASSASAAERDGVCDGGEVCFFYNSDFQGAVSDFTGSVENYGSRQPDCYEFKGPKARGGGECMKNEAASVVNNTSGTVRVYFNSGFKGHYQDIPAGERVNLREGDEPLKNQNASHRIIWPAPTNPCYNKVCPV